jgi:uncharacterized cupredoxin-like copper-binding protein
MKMKTFFSLLVAASICGLASVRAADQTAGEKASDAWDATKKGTKQAAHAVANTTKKAAKSVEKTVTGQNAASGQVHKVDINMLDRGLQMPSTVPAGRVLFTVKNGGDLNHTCAMTGGTLKDVSLDVAPGKSGTMELSLTPGKYQAYCKFAGHEGKEARSSFTVQ